MTEGARPGIADRAQAAAEVADTPADKRPPTMAMVIHNQRHEIERALPTHLKASVEAFERAAITLVKLNKDLAKCEPATVLGGLMVASQLGLQLGGPLGHAYLVPFGGKAQFILGYKGAIDLAWRSNRLKSIEARTVYMNDAFTYEYGLDPKLVHTPILEGEPGEPRCYYGVAHFKDGGHYFVVVSRAEVEKHRKRSKTGNRGPWVDDYDAMAKKTVINIMKPFLPLTTEVMREMSQDGVIATGNSVTDLETEEVDYDYDTGEIFDAEVVGS